MCEEGGDCLRGPSPHRCPQGRRWGCFFFLSSHKGHQGSEGLEAVRWRALLSTPKVQELQKQPHHDLLSLIPNGDKTDVTPFCSTFSHLEAQRFTDVHVNANWEWNMTWFWFVFLKQTRMINLGEMDMDQDLWRWAVTLLGSVKWGNGRPVLSTDTWLPVNSWLDWDLGSLDAPCVPTDILHWCLWPSESSCCGWRCEVVHLILMIGQVIPKMVTVSKPCLVYTLYL